MAAKKNKWHFIGSECCRCLGD